MSEEQTITGEKPLRTSELAVWSFRLAITCVVVSLLWLTLFSLVASETLLTGSPALGLVFILLTLILLAVVPLAFIFGVVSYLRLGLSNGQTRGRGFALAGIWLSLLTPLFGIGFVSVCAKVMQPQTIIYDALEQLIDQERTMTVDLTTITDFDWDHLYAFPPYTMDDKVSSALGENYAAIKKRHISQLSGGNVLVVFVHRDKVVYYECSFPKYRLIGAHGSFMIKREKAVFEVKSNQGRGPYELHEIDRQ